MLAKLHLAEDAFALHSLFEDTKSLVDIVVADKNLHKAWLSASLMRAGRFYGLLNISQVPTGSSAPLCMITAFYQM